MGFILFIHITVSILLVITILMQAGKGSGLAESFSSAESMFGTQTNKFMVRLSTVLAVIFISTSLFLAFKSSTQTGSLMSNTKMIPKVTAPVTQEEQAPIIKIEDPKPLVEQAQQAVKSEAKPEVAQIPVTNATK